MSSKTIISSAMVIGLTLGGYIPWLFGDRSYIDGWTILGGFVGGCIGIWLGAKVARRYR